MPKTISKSEFHVDVIPVHRGVLGMGVEEGIGLRLFGHAFPYEVPKLFSGDGAVAVGVALAAEGPEEVLGEETVLVLTVFVGDLVAPAGGEDDGPGSAD